MRIEQIPSLERLLEQLRKLPYLSSKNLYRVALALIDKSEQEVEVLCDVIKRAKLQIKKCKICFAWSEQELCHLCSSDRRDQSLVCVVGTWPELQLMENSTDFTGVYHVLGGLISPLEGVSPEHLTISQLLSRLQAGKIKEVVFATRPTPEGEVTASYIASEAAGVPGVKFTRLASGVPMGASLEYLDKVTLTKALAERQIF